MNERPPRLLRGDQVLDKLHKLGMDDLDKTWLDNACRYGHLSFTKVGKHRRFREDLLDKWINERFEEAA